MALINTDGNYLKIRRVSIEYTEGLKGIIILYDLYQTKDLRINGVGQFGTSVLEQVQYNNFTFSNKITFDDTLLTSGYETLKINEFSDWTDD